MLPGVNNRVMQQGLTPVFLHISLFILVMQLPDVIAGNGVDAEVDSFKQKRES